MNVVELPLQDSPPSAWKKLPPAIAVERHEIVALWNATEAEYPHDKCVHELFEAQAARTPEAIAVVYDGAQLTYAELNAKANRLAHHLRTLGVQPDARVAICMERSFDMVVGLLAILKAGGAYVPLDSGYPAERLAFMIEDCAPVAVLTHAQAQARLPAAFAAALAVIDLADAERWSKQTDGNPDLTSIGLSPRHLAYVIYTSGSTGQPKGVIAEHKGIVNSLTWMQRVYCLSAQDRVLQKTPFGFDPSVREIFLPLLNGATLVMARPEGHKDPEYLAEIISRERITILNFVPSMLRAFLENGEAQKCAELTRVFCAGEVLPTSLARRFHDLLPNVQLHNFYGPSENTQNATVFDWNVGWDTPSGSVPIGRPISNTRIYILDSYGDPVPIGVAGEIYIGGVGVARGYLNRPELTAGRFVPSPFVEGDRLYKTGDLGRYLADGNIEFLGRNDFQVKIRGFRIEPGEIEACLTQHPAVREAVVVAREDTPGDQWLVAYYTGRSGRNQDAVRAEALRTHLSAKLPEYMVPAAYVWLQELPLNANGKLDRKALPAPERDAYAARAYEAPQTETEELVAQIWAEVLKLKRVGRQDHFFELGGDSLLAVRVISRLRRQGFHADVRTLFAAPKLAALAATVGDNAATVEVPPNGIPRGCGAITPQMLPLVNLTQGEIDRIVDATPGGAGNIQDIYPLAPLQEGILFHHLMVSEGDPYLLQTVLGFDSRARVEVYLDALRAVIDRHDILRTAVLWEGLTEPVQVVCREAPLPVEEVELDPAAGDIAGQMRARFDARHFRLDVRRAPLMRLFIAHDREHDRWLMVELLHHLSDDRTTRLAIQQEIQAHLMGQGENLPAPLPFRNFVAQARLGVSREEHEAFFREILGDVEEPTAPFGLTDIHGDGSGICEARRSIDPALAKRLRGRARALGVGPASLFHLAWAQVLARVSGRDDVVFGTVLFGRMQAGEGSDRALGPFINTLPIRIRIGEEAVADIVRRTHELLTRLLRHEHAPLALAQRCSAVAQPAPLFTALLNLRHSAVAGEADGEASQIWEGINYLGGEERTNYPFTLSVEDLGVGFALTTQVRSPLDPERICGLMYTAVEKLAAALESSPLTPVRLLDVMPPAERHQLLYAWNATEMPFPADRCVHELFEKQVARTPDAVAVIFEDEQLSYAELNARSNCLAHYLIAQGVTPDSLVAIYVQRSLDMVVGLLAILKAGGAYVPLDPAYPAERLAFMIEDSAPVAVLTHAQAQGRLPASFTATVPVIDLANAERWSKQPDCNPDRTSIGLTAQHLAYVIYTSGSTGQPKGVMVEHSALANTVTKLNSYLNVTNTTRFSALSAISFDPLAYQVLCPLCAGSASVLVPDEIKHDGPRLAAYLNERDTSIVSITPLHAAILFDGSPKLRCQTLLIGGDALPYELTNRIKEAGLASRLFNLYGPTETCINACCHEVSSVTSGLVPIGKPLANYRVYILDGHGEPAPIGVAGEIYIGGAGIARGYLNRPMLTAERFLADPFAADGEARMYRTGDLGRWLADGNVEFLGRNDFQVKIRGFRIELGEIEARLAQHPAVREAAVIDREDTPGDKRLVAYYTSIDPNGSSVGAESLRAHLSANLPDYMVPAAYVRLDALPLTTNGKLNREALPSPRSDAYTARGYEAPAGEFETRLAQTWADVLKIERVGRNDNFFELGGHSLLAVRLASQVASAFGVRFSVASLFAAPTVRELAARLSKAEMPPEPCNIFQIQPLGTKTPIIAINHPMMCHKLSRSLGTDRRFLAVQVFDPNNPQPLPSRSLEEIAADYVRLIRVAQPSGPYILFGLCTAGLIAYEAARQLQEAGASVPLIVMADAWSPGYSVPLTFAQRILWILMRLSIKLRYHERRLALVRSGGLRIEEYLGQTRLVRWNKFLNLLSSLGLMEDPSEAVEVNSRGGWFLPALQKALANYRVPVTTSDVVLLNSEIVPVADFIDPTLGWSDFVEGRLLHYRVPGFHYYMFQDEKAAALTAESLKPLLDRVDLDADRTANICSS